MRLRSRLVRGAGALSLVAATAPSPSPTPSPPPVFVLHRNASASFVDPARANPLFALIIGSDIREGDPATGRADSLHIVAVNTQNGMGTIVGIPRDLFVDVHGAGRRKIGESLYHGGVERTVETVGRISGIPIHYWAIADFSRFRTLVDRLGGLTVEIPYPMRDRFSGAFFDPGRRHLGGADLLAFTRNRHDAPGGDVGRSENHGRVLLAALGKFRSEASDPLGMFRYVSAFRDLVATNVPISDLLVLGSIGRRLDPAAISNVVIPTTAGDVDGQSVVFMTPQADSIFAAVRDDGRL